MNHNPDYFIFDNNNYNNNSLFIRDKSKSNWKMRNILQKQNLEPLLHKGPSQSINNPYTFKSIYDVNYPSIDSFNSDLKNNFLEKEKFQAKLIAPAINVNLKLPRI